MNGSYGGFAGLRKNPEEDSEQHRRVRRRQHTGGANENQSSPQNERAVTRETVRPKKKEPGLFTRRNRVRAQVVLVKHPNLLRRLPQVEPGKEIGLTNTQPRSTISAHDISPADIVRNGQTQIRS